MKPRIKDTPRRYIYMDLWGLSACTALSLIARLRRVKRGYYSESFIAQLDVDRGFFINALRRQNGLPERSDF